MKAIADDPKLVRWVIAMFLGIPVAVVLGAAFPERQGAQFVPFLLTGIVALGIVWLVSEIGTRWWFRRRRGEGR